MAYQARRRSRELRLGEDELILARRQLDELRDGLYVVRCAIEDVERDLAARFANRPVKSCAEALDWLLDAARPLDALQV